jgi:Trk-type K+ transport system membrane component
VGQTFAIAAIWLMGLAVLFAVTFVLLLHTSPQLRPDRAALLAAAACGNCGIGIDPVTVAGNDAYVLAAAMLLGRALPWGVLWWSAMRGDEPLAVG